MSYAEKFLKSRGQDCIIERTVPINTRVSIKRSTKASRDLGVREAYWEGLIPQDVNLISGEIISIGIDKYLIQSTNYDHASTECAFFSAKCNAIVKHKRFIEDVDENYNPIQEWKDINPNRVDIPCYGTIVNYKLRQEEAGLLDSTVYIFQVPKTLGVEFLDRFVFAGKNYQVDSIDDIGMAGIARIQLSVDNRL